MKYLLSILFVVFSLNLVTARGGGGHGGGHSSSHSSGHSSSHSSSHSSGHTTTHHVSHGSGHTTAKTTRSYTKVTRIQPSEIHVYHGNTHFLYYYLIFNHNTGSHDTIQSNTKEDLQTQALEISDVDDSPLTTAEIIAIVVGIIALVALVLYLCLKK